jgi:hypothetical protein
MKTLKILSSERRIDDFMKKTNNYNRSTAE